MIRSPHRSPLFSPLQSTCVRQAPRARKSRLPVAACFAGLTFLAGSANFTSVATAQDTPGITLAEIVALAQPTATEGEAALVEESPLNALEKALIGGSVHANLRLRYEYADRRGLDVGKSASARLRLGYKTGEWQGLTAFVEFEGTRNANQSQFNSTTNGQAGRTVIADPDSTELNQLWVHYKLPDGYGWAKVGRQRIALDDARFIGNVGWRQNEQTYDAVHLAFNPHEDVTLQYIYLENINRIFGSSATNDFDSDSHAFNASYSGFDFGKIVVFAYLFDFDNSAANSVDTYGIRFNGKQKLAEDLSIAYAFSYAFQVDGKNNPADYEADYFSADVSLTKCKVTGGIGYELLGSDSGSQFRTPLATAHKFNGYADLFLGNGGAAGLQDFYVYIAGTLPGGFKGKVAYHYFMNDSPDTFLGQEIDFVVSKKLTKNATALVKYAHFYDAQVAAFPRTTRIDAQIDFKF